MATELPQEIIDLIADHLQKSQVSLAPCTMVCRQWKAAFEPLIYSTLNIYSGDSKDLSPHWGSWRKGIPEKSISLSQFKSATSGTGNTRRKMIRHLSYHIIVPFILKDWTFLKNSAYTTDNDIRNNNDLVFQSAMLDLFEFLSSWEPTLPLSLALRVVGRELKREPETTYSGDAFRHPLDRCKNPKKCVPVYRAKFEENMASSLPFVTCIDRLAFEKFVKHQIWAGSALQIAQKCSTLTELQLDLDEDIRPDFLHYIKARRQGKFPSVTSRLVLGK